MGYHASDNVTVPYMYSASSVGPESEYTITVTTSSVAYLKSRTVGVLGRNLHPF